MFSFHKQSLFTKNVSQKICHLRFNAKKRSMEANMAGSSSSGVVKKKFKPTMQPMPEIAVTVTNEGESELESELETAEHLREIARIWGKQKVTETDRTDTKQLLKATRKSWMQLLQDHPDGRLAPVMEKYLCFTDGSMVNIFLSLAVTGLAISQGAGIDLFTPINQSDSHFPRFFGVVIQCEITPCLS